MSAWNDKHVVGALINNDPAMIEEFFFNRCRAALTYIGRYFCDTEESPESLIGEFYVYMSDNDWHKLRIFRFSCSLNAYISVVATRYFQNKRDMRLNFYGNEPPSVMEKSSEPYDSFTRRDIERLVSEMKPIDRFLIERILIDGDKPSDILDDVKHLMDEALLCSMDNKQLTGYVYTRYSRAKRKLQNQLIALGYGT